MPRRLLGVSGRLAPSQLKVTILVTETPVTRVPDKVFVLLTAEFPPGVSTARHTIRATNTAP
jgi:hypothetical protein